MGEDAADPSAATRHGATLGQAFDLLDADRRALVASGKRSEASIEFFTMARRVWQRYAGRLIDGVTCSDDDLDEDRLDALVELGKRAALSTVGAPFVDGFIRYRREHGKSENTIAKNRIVLRSALALAKRAGVWTGDLDAMLPHGFETGYEPRRVKLTHAQGDKLIAYFAKTLPHRAAQIAFCLATGAEARAVERARRTDLKQVPVPLHGTKTSDRERHAFAALPWQEELLAFAAKHCDGANGLAFTPWANSARDIPAACTELKLPRMTLHSLRHVFGAWALDDGVDPSVVAVALGHRDTRMLERVYDTRDPGTIQRRAVEQVGARAHLRVIQGGRGTRKTTPAHKKASA